MNTRSALILIYACSGIAVSFFVIKNYYDNIPRELEEAARIDGCEISTLPKPEWGRYTQKGNTIYAHVYETPLGALPLYGIAPERLKKVYYLADGSEMNRGEAWNTVLYTENAFVSFGENPVFTYPLPDEKDTVLKIELKDADE